MPTLPRVQIAAALLLAGAASAHAADNWALTFTPQAMTTRYADSPSRDKSTTMGGFLNAQYLDRAGFAVGGSHTVLKFNNGAANTVQNAGYVSGNVGFTPDSLPGKITVRGDLHGINNNDPTNETDGVRVYAAQLAFAAFSKQYALDLGYAHSSYGDSNVGNGSLRVRQWTPTVGMAFNGGSDWLQLRYYRVETNNGVRSHNVKWTNSVEAKLTHYFAPRHLVPEQIQIGALVGRRIYAVDSDTASVYNLADMQKAGLLANAQWRVLPNVRFLIGGSFDRYEGTSGAENKIYTGRLGFVALSGNW